MKKSSLALFITLMSVVVLLLVGTSQTTTYAQPQTDMVVRFSPSKIKPNDSYTLHVERLGEPYTGALYFDLRLCDLNLSNCTDYHGPWLTATNGIVNVPGGQDFPPGIYLTRFKRAGYPDTDYSNFDLLVVDNEDTINENIFYSSTSISPPPVGSYMIFENNVSGGYTRIDIETDACELDGYTMRFTKTNADTYWNAPYASAFRWCVKNTSDTSGLGTTLRAISGTLYDYPGGMENAASQINVTYPGNGFGFATTQGLLGSFGTFNKFGTYVADLDMKMHYSLLPKNRKVPRYLSSTPNTIVNLAFGHPLHSVKNGMPTGEEGFDYWHSEVLAPTNGGTLRMRYVETGAEVLENQAPDILWSVTEDWEWRTDGILTAIKMWRESPVLCWRNGYNCESGGWLQVDLELVDWHIPSSTDELVLWLDDSSIYNDESYTLNAKFKGTNDPYHGFLEIDAGNGPSLWRDIENKPIYVSNGKVTVGPNAYGNISVPTSISFSARPFLTNSSISSTDEPTEDVTNAGTAQWSDSVTLTITPR